MDTQLIAIRELIPAPSRPVADSKKLARHGDFRWSKYTPIILEKSGEKFWLMDGVTRVENALRAGINELPAYVFEWR